LLSMGRPGGRRDHGGGPRNAIGQGAPQWCTYSGIVEACFDAADAWHSEHGIPKANPHGPRLIVS